MDLPLLAIENLTLEFKTRLGVVRAIEGVNLSVPRGETVGIVGESGSGKSVLAMAVMGISDSAARIRSGAIHFDRQNLLSLKESSLRKLRGKHLSMIFQSPRSALNPIRQVGKQLEDVLKAHADIPRSQLKQQAISLLAQVRIPDPQRRYFAYPYELSGGQCQRIGIALALACSPKLLIADEPTTGLDVTTQAAIMQLIRDLARKTDMATAIITHDLGLAADYCDRIAVMHAGHIVEVAPTGELFDRPYHPYTAKLIAATPDLVSDMRHLVPIAGNLPDLRGTLPSCRFSKRCDRYHRDCEQPLSLKAIAPNRQVACWRPL